MPSARLASYWIALLVGIASGSVGPFILLRRMALVGDALSHVALPGIALAILYGLDPFYGVVAFLIAAAFLIFWLEGRSRIPPDAIVGLLFTASLAVGILMIPNGEVIESLFGAFPVLSLPFLLVILVSSAVLATLCFVLARRFVFLIVSPDLAKVNGIGRKYDLVLLLIFSLIVALGIKLVGTLLMGALTIIPAAIARNVSRSMRAYLIISALLGGVVAVGGMWMADSLRLLPGPSIILFGVGAFVASLAIRRQKTA
ncbi:MAG TPA: metal ABC transporter permease [Bryobacteraceae bacterium]|jgi:zinc transport system permease protein|nr:metal ABC transporter permease [Bryobacteraceae bacterium]